MSIDFLATMIDTFEVTEKGFRKLEVYEYTVFNNDLKPIGAVFAKSAEEAIKLARKPWLPNPIVENTTLLKRKDPLHKPTSGLEFISQAEAGLAKQYKPRRVYH